MAEPRKDELVAETIFLNGVHGAMLLTEIAAGLSRFDRDFRRMTAVAKTLSIYKNILQFTFCDIDPAVQAFKPKLRSPLACGLTLRPNISSFAKHAPTHSPGWAMFKHLATAYKADMLNEVQQLDYKSAWTHINNLARDIVRFVIVSSPRGCLHDSYFISDVAAMKYFADADGELIAGIFSSWTFRLSKEHKSNDPTKIVLYNTGSPQAEGPLVRVFTDCYDQARHEQVVTPEPRQLTPVRRVPGITEGPGPVAKKVAVPSRLEFTLNFPTGGWTVDKKRVEDEYNRALAMAVLREQALLGPGASFKGAAIKRVKACTDPRGQEADRAGKGKTVTGNIKLRKFRGKFVHDELTKLKLDTTDCVIVEGQQEPENLELAEFRNRYGRSVKDNTELYSFMRRVDVTAELTFEYDTVDLPKDDEPGAEAASLSQKTPPVQLNSLTFDPFSQSVSRKLPAKAPDGQVRFGGADFTVSASAIQEMGRRVQGAASSKVGYPRAAALIIGSIIEAAGAIYPLHYADHASDIQKHECPASSIKVKMDKYEDCTGWALPLAEAIRQSGVASASSSIRRFEELNWGSDPGGLKSSFVKQFSDTTVKVAGLANQFLFEKGKRFTADVDWSSAQASSVYLACMENKQGEVLKNSGHVAFVFSPDEGKTWVGLHVASGWNPDVKPAKGSVTMHVFSERSTGNALFVSTKFGSRTKRLIKLI